MPGELEGKLDGIRQELARSREADEDIRIDLQAQRNRTAEFDRAVPRGLQIFAAWSWRVLLIAALL